MSLVVTEVALPKQNRVAPPGRPSQYHDQLKALTAGTKEALVEADVTDDAHATKVKQRFSSAIAGYRKRTGSREKFTIRDFRDDAGKLYVGVWKLEGEIAPAKPKAAAATDANTGADNA